MNAFPETKEEEKTPAMNKQASLTLLLNALYVLSFAVVGARMEMIAIAMDP